MNKKNFCNKIDNIARFTIFYFLFILLYACNKRNNTTLNKEKKSNNIEIVLSEYSDNFIKLMNFDYDITSKSIYACYYGKQRNMHYYYYRLEAKKPFSLEIYGSQGQGPEKFSHPVHIVRVIDPFIMIGTYNSIKIFDKQGSFVNLITEIPFFIHDFYFKDGLLTAITEKYIFKSQNSDNVFFSYDVTNRKILKCIKFKDVKSVFKKNGIDFKKLHKNRYPTISGRVLNEEVAVLKINFEDDPDVRNAFVIANLKNNKLTFFRPKPYYRHSLFFNPLGVSISAADRKAFLLVEIEQLNQINYMKHKDFVKNLKQLNKPLSFCIHKINQEGKEIGVYPFSWGNIRKKIVKIICWNVIEIEPSKFFLLTTIYWKDGGLEDIYILWNAKKQNTKINI